MYHVTVLVQIGMEWESKIQSLPGRAVVGGKAPEVAYNLDTEKGLLVMKIEDLTLTVNVGALAHALYGGPGGNQLKP